MHRGRSDGGLRGVIEYGCTPHTSPLSSICMLDEEKNCMSPESSSNSQFDLVFSTVFATAVVVTSIVLVASASFRMFGSRQAKTLTANSIKHKFPLIEKIVVTDSTRIFRLGLPSPEHILGLPIGKHIMVSAELMNPLTGEGPPKYIARQYTPITSDYSSKGYFELLVKVYRKNEHPRFPEGGWMSQYLESLSIGDTVDIRGPFGRIEYLERGLFRVGGSEDINATHVAMVAGGTGITPMYQLIAHVLRDRKGVDGLKLSLLYGNQHPEDILLHDTLLEFAKEYPDQFSLSLTVDKVNEGQSWDGFQGYVSAEMIRASLPSPGPDVLVLLCGAPMMVKSVETVLLQEQYPKDRIIAY
jgi:cytochrome-b5 reductase